MSDFNINQDIYDILIRMNSKLIELQKQKLDFKTVFQKHLNPDGSIFDYILKEKFLYKYFLDPKMKLTKNDLDQIVNFLDQKNDKIISEEEFNFVFEISKIIEDKVKIEKENQKNIQSQIKKLVGMNDNVFRLFSNLQSVILADKINIENLVSAYDQNES